MESHEALLDRWSKQPHHKGKGFIRDGIIDPELWGRAPRKVLLLLKEAYDEPGVTEGFDLREVIRDEWKGPRYKIWWTAAYWCYAIHHASSCIPALPESDRDYAAAGHSLLSSATINIKKSHGRSTSDDTEIGHLAQRDGEFLRAQVETIDPCVVICGNTWWAIRHLWPDAELIYGGLVWRVRSRLFIDFWHPANRFPNALNYYALGCLVQNSDIAPVATKPNSI
ncbi:MAG: hypothetical protein JSR19_02105 [Proteobacteria bacterium]|nr:hypothetical protein [Pseudomonadota bacterium]HQR03590.1 hypothetical protein [Rhodocyclaceae bacterium]